MTTVQVWLSRWTGSDDHACSVVPNAHGRVCASAWHSKGLYCQRMTCVSLTDVIEPHSGLLVMSISDFQLHGAGLLGTSHRTHNLESITCIMCSMLQRDLKRFLTVRRAAAAQDSQLGILPGVCRLRVSLRGRPDHSHGWPLCDWSPLQHQAT